MWQTLRKHPTVSSDPTDTAIELLKSTSRNLILLTGAAYLAWHAIATTVWPLQFGWNVWGITAVVVLTSVVALRLLTKRFVVAQLVWLIGLAAAITLSAYIFRAPEIAFSYALLPLTAGLILGWPGALLAELSVAGLVWWLSNGGLVSVQPAYGLSIIIGGAFAGLLGCGATQALVTATQWSFSSWTMARENLEVARQHQAELSRAMSDLDRAYHRMYQANAALDASSRTAAEAEHAKTQFVSNVSHELRTPLNLIIGFAETMMTSPESYGGVEIPGQYRSDLNAIYRSSQHLLSLVDDVLDLSRIEGGKMVLAREEADLHTLVAETTDMAADYIAAKGLELRVSLSPDLPLVRIDRLRIRQVLLNLLVNAVRFTERGSVTLSMSRRDGEVLVQVSDTGRGIPQQDLPKVFEEFRTTTAPTSTWHSGTGLGLPISKQFVDLHQGRMGVESIYGRGATFWFTLPVEPRPAIPRETRPARGSEPREYERAEPAVIVVHEDPGVSDLLGRYLDGYRVLGAGTMQEALHLATDEAAVALVLPADDEHEDPTGEIPVIRCPLPESHQAAAALGADDILGKPVSRQRLLAAVDRLEHPVERVLVADDEPEVARLFRRMLRTRISPEGFIEAYNGAEALALMRSERPDLLLLDLMMPEVDGHTVLDQMAGDTRLADIPVIVVSAKTQDYLEVRLPGAFRVERDSGFELSEVVRMLRANLGAMAPGWRPAEHTGARPAEVPAA